MKVISVNLNGIRSACKKGLLDWIAAENPDVVCMQELKAQEPEIASAVQIPDGYCAYFHYAEKKGYSGVGIFARRAPDRVIEGFGDAEFDSEGRYLQADFGNLSIVSLYLPSGSSSDDRQQAKFRCMNSIWPRFAELAASGRDVLICGDWNIAHTEKDLKNWKSNQKNSGFLPEERAWLSKLFDEQGWIDVHRRLAPDATGEAYTWWSNRGQAWAKNVGWRIDYHIAVRNLAEKATSVSVYKDQRFSDHAPVIVEYDVGFL